jgi:hypothetical protein
MTCWKAIVSVLCLELVAGCERRDAARAPTPADNGRGLPASVTSQPAPTRFVVAPSDQTDVDTTERVQPEWRWGRVEVDGESGVYRPVRADWHTEPQEWELRRLADVPALSPALRAALSRLDCVIPRWRPGNDEGSVAAGEFERAGQRDVAVLCVHGDQSANTYIFWNGDPSRRETMSNSGNSIGTVTQRWIQTAADPQRPLEPDMPAVVDHEGLEIGCCECCSTIYYRHDGKWFSLPGGD